MFSKNSDAEKLETVIGKNTQFTGDIVCKGTLKVSGRVTGNVEADWLHMSEKSYLKGDCKVGGTVVAGYIEGNVQASEVIEVRGSGQVKGDVSTSKLIVIEGGVMDGNVTMQKASSKVVELNQDRLKEAKS